MVEANCQFEMSLEQLRSCDIVYPFFITSESFLNRLSVLKQVIARPKPVDSYNNMLKYQLLVVYSVFSSFILVFKNCFNP